MGEMQTKVAELQMSLNGEIKRLREALMGRVDEMSGYLHRDMVVMREEMHSEMTQLKTDLFTAATGLSSVKDRLLTVETRGREESAAGFAEIEGRLARQETAFATALDNIERKLTSTFESKCAEAFAVLARKSDVAALLDKFGSLIEENKPGVDIGWFSAAAVGSPVAPSQDTWATLAAGEDPSAKARDWLPTHNPFFADGNTVT